MRVLSTLARRHASMEDGAFTLVLLEESILKGFKRRGKECVGNRWPVYSDFFFCLVCFYYVQTNPFIHIESAKMKEVEVSVVSLISEGGI